MKLNLQFLRAPVIRFFAISELTLLLCVALPSVTTPIVAALIGIIKPNKALGLLWVGASGLLAYLIALLFFASVFDSIRLRKLKARRVPSRVAPALDEALADIKYLPGARISSTDIRVVLQDISIGAQIRGIVRSRIVISGGMLVALTAKTPIAGAILVHELAHVKNHDRLFTGVILVVALEILLSTVLPFVSRNGIEFYELVYMASHIYAMLWLLGYLSRRREYFSDALAFVMLDRPAIYIAALATSGSHARHGETFFHPELHERVLGLCKKSPVLFPSVAMILFWLVAANVRTLPLDIVVNSGEQSDWFGDLESQGVSFFGSIGLALEASKILSLVVRRPRDYQIGVEASLDARSRNGERWFQTLFSVLGFSVPRPEVIPRLKWALSGAIVFFVSYAALGQGSPVGHSLFLSGLLLGPAQWWAFRKRARGVGWWLAVTSIGWIMGLVFAGSFIVPFFAPAGSRSPVMRMDEGLIYVDGAVPVAVFCLYGAFGAFSVGILQWITVWRRFAGGIWWILITTLGGLFSGGLQGSIFSRMEQGEVRSIDALAATLFVINGFTIGLLGGGIAIWLGGRKKV